MLLTAAQPPEAMAAVSASANTLAWLPPASRALAMMGTAWVTWSNVMAWASRDGWYCRLVCDYDDDDDNGGWWWWFDLVKHDGVQVTR